MFWTCRSARRSRRHRAIVWLTVLPLLVSVSGCRFTESGFDKAASSAAGEMEAAAVTIQFAHTGKMTSQYARAAFVNYQEQLSGVDSSLQSAPGAPGKAALHRLIRLLRAAERAVTNPCITGSCNWKGQVKSLGVASKALQKASGG